MRTQPKRDKLFWSTRYKISNHFRHSFCSTLLDLTRAIDPRDSGYDLESQQPSRYTRECLTVLRVRTHDMMFREDDSDLLKEFRCAFVKRIATGTFVLMHILFSSAMSRTIFYYDAQLSRWSNFDLNSRRTLCHDGKLIERTVNTFPPQLFASAERRVICDDEESFVRRQCQYCHS